MNITKGSVSSFDMECSNYTKVECTTLWPMEDLYEWEAPAFDISVKNVILAIVLTSLDIVTIFGNLLLIVAFAVEKRIRQPFNLFILNLAVTDFLVAITAMTFYTIDTLLGYWPFGYVMCGMWIYFDFAMTFASVFTLVAISIDRFWCVTWAIQYKKYSSRFRTTIVLLIIWAFVITIWTPPFIEDRLKHTNEHVCIWEPSDNRKFVIFVAVVGHYIPCGIMVFCYFKVFYAMKQQSTRIRTNLTAGPGSSSNTRGTIQVTVQSISEVPNARGRRDSGQYLFPDTDPTVLHARGTLSRCMISQHTSTASGSTNLDSMSASYVFPHEKLRMSPPGDSANKVNRHDDVNHPTARLNQNMNRDRKIFVTLTYVLGCYLVCWFPFYIVFDTYAWRPDLVPAELYTVFFWIPYVNSALNPFIYAYTCKEFRAAFIKVIKRMYGCKT